MAGNFEFKPGLPGWSKKIKEFMDANEYKYTEWDNSGITYLNGFAANGSGVQWRTIDIGNQHTLQTKGWLSTPALKANQIIEAFTLPTSILKTDGSDEFNNVCWWGDQWAVVKIDGSTGIVKFTNMASRDSGVMAPSNIAINTMFSW